MALVLVCSFTACSEAMPEPDAAAAPAAAPAAAAAVAAPPPEPGPIAGTSTTMIVAGEYAPLALDRVARVSLEESRLVVHGSSSRVAVDLPAGADASRTTRHWALVTESHLDGGRRSLTFTHSESLEDFTIQLPESAGSVRYGGFERREGGEILVFAWGEASATYWGWVLITRPDPGAR